MENVERRAPGSVIAAGASRLRPSGLRGGSGDRPTTARRQFGRPGNAALQATQPAKSRRMRIHVANRPPALQERDAFRRRVTGGAGRSDLLRPFGLHDLLFAFTDETTALYPDFVGN